MHPVNNSQKHGKTGNRGAKRLAPNRHHNSQMSGTGTATETHASIENRRVHQKTEKQGNMVRGKEKSNASLRRDPSWKYSVQVDIGGGEKTYVYLKCNFCDKVVKGGVTRMNEHLSDSHKNVAPCANVPDKVKKEISAYMKKSTTAKHLQHEQFDDRVEHASYYESESGKGSSSTIHSRGARGPMDQYMVNPGEDRGQTQMMSAAGKRTVGNIEDDEDLTFIDTIGEEDSLEDPFSNGT
ncbi:hypothetical protein M5K25_012869 [Dendrobium thyrsiflorum]|uniref:BED-type domain-containing protein n=1 Tax=Dendrobium thyrsiflorum TaxID=117978 RepID=A0ABD0V5C4_DENTH